MKKFSMLVAVGLFAGSASAALMTGGYSVGSGSQLLVGNGGSGTNLFVDSAATGGNVDLVDDDGYAAWFTVLIPGASQWNIGDTVEITGVALAVRGVTVNGTFTFDILEAAGGSGTSGAGGLASLGTATATYNNSGSTDAMYVNFDAPVSFVVDANSANIGINISNSGKIGLKAQAGFPVTRYNSVNGNLQTSQMKFSVAGNVVPEPASIGLIASVGGAILFIRRRLQM
ncbi:PEP-CTERM sorting domain-containing protein [Pontiellaceae bacterium B12227]|nr:PEP-CTERM sorting domain-containing protein [Pontiellaceae bacterium B12227]